MTTNEIIPFKGSREWEADMQRHMQGGEVVPANAVCEIARRIFPDDLLNQGRFENLLAGVAQCAWRQGLIEGIKLS